jgi:molecular chaperone GrpE
MSPDRLEPEILPDEPMTEAVAELDPDEGAEIDPATLGLDLSSDLEAARQELLGAVLQARRDATEYLDTLQRVAADFDNYRKRVERDQGEVVHRATRRLIEHLLPSLDSFDAALAYDTQTPTEEKILEGMRGTHALLMDMLAKEGLEPIEAVGAPFDPSKHEAVSGPGGDSDLSVSQELRRGYTLAGRVIRPSLVAVEGGER